MKVSELIEKLKQCDPKAELRLIDEDELECIPEWWDDKKGEYGGVCGLATDLYSEDLHSHQMYLLAITGERL